MPKLRVIFTVRKYNPISLAIRVATPRGLFSIAESSHCLVVDGDFATEAHLLHGVRRVPLAEALKGLTIVRTVDYEVLDAEAGLSFLRSQVGKRYDYKGACGLGLAPDRNWQDPEDWFCFELAAAGLAAAGRTLFRDNAHITGTTLLAIIPTPLNANENHKEINA